MLYVSHVRYLISVTGKILKTYFRTYLFWLRNYQIVSPVCCWAPEIDSIKLCAYKRYKYYFIFCILDLTGVQRTSVPKIVSMTTYIFNNYEIHLWTLPTLCLLNHHHDSYEQYIHFIRNFELPTTSAINRLSAKTKHGGSPSATDWCRVFLYKPRLCQSFRICSALARIKHW